ncbi:MAG: TetR/AcrR family transcriptional regulator [Opitutales bacterium]
MPRTPPQSDPARLLPVITLAFAELGYRRATTAELARRCRVRENVLYRAWADKKQMFLAAIDHVYASSLAAWTALLAQNGPKDPAGRLLEYESIHHGEFGLYRIVFVALSETDDPDIREALRAMYRRFHEFIRARLPRRRRPSAVNTAWAVIGLGTVSNILRELGLVPEARRRRLFIEIGRLFLRGSGR